jgi:glyoxylase-like metal-dependent hydrolase (beta-lactamase superfamily II)
MTRTALLAVLLCACSHSPRSDGDESPADERATPGAADDEAVQIKTTAMGGNVHMLEGRGGNIGVSAGNDGALIIDDQFEPLAPKIRAAVDALGGGGLKFVINTHWHGDHTGGNVVFGKDATIIAHTNVRRRLSTEQNVRGRVTPPLPDEGLPMITFAESVTLHFNGEEVRVIHFPHGHTDGDSVVYFAGSNVVHMGDHYFNGRFPFVDMETGGDVQQYATNVGKVIEMVPADARVIPGHGPASDVEELRAFHGMLTETIDSVRAQMKAGKRPKQMKLDNKWVSWGSGFIDSETWIQTIHASLTKKS